MASIEKRIRDGQTRWCVRYRTPSGEQRNKTFTRKVDAERYLTGIEHSKITGSYMDPGRSKIAVGVWSRQWLESQTHLKPTTRARYEGILSKHVEPRWDPLRCLRSPTPTCRNGSPDLILPRRRCATCIACSR
jgi:hypothetical protein